MEIVKGDWPGDFPVRKLLNDRVQDGFSFQEALWLRGDASRFRFALELLQVIEVEDV